MTLQPGTRVVLLSPVPGARGLNPAGSVAEVVDGPTGNDRSYCIRFVHGQEAWLGRDAFMLLAEAKSMSVTPPLDERELRSRIALQCVVGSRAYGLETDESDTDRRGVYIAPVDAVLSLYEPPEQFEHDETQECYWEIKKFLILALKANPNILEVLYSPIVEVCTDDAKRLLEMRDIFLSKLVYQTFNGYVVSQFRKMKRSMEVRRAPNWKHAMHLVRLLQSGISILRDRTLDVQTRDRDALLEIKAGQWSWDRVDRWRRDLHESFDGAFASTALPDRPDYDRANRYLIDVRRGSLAS